MNRISEKLTVLSGEVGNLLEILNGPRDQQIKQLVQEFTKYPKLQEYWNGSLVEFVTSRLKQKGIKVDNHLRKQLQTIEMQSACLRKQENFTTSPNERPLKMNSQLNAHEWLTGQHRITPQPKAEVQIPEGPRKRIVDAISSELSAEHLQECTLAVREYANDSRRAIKLGLSCRDYVSIEMEKRGVNLPEQLLSVFDAEQSTFNYLASER